MTNLAVVDLHGVLLDCDHGFLNVAQDVLDRPLTKLNNRYSFRDRYGLTSKETSMVFSAMDHHPRGWRGLDALPGALEGFNMLRNMGYQIQAATCLPVHVKDIQWDCLRQHGFELDDVHCVGFGQNKIAVLSSLRPHVYVEDRLHHLHDVPFVPHRVWIDHQDDQDGHVPTEEIYHTTGLLSWAKQWAVSGGKQPRFSF